MDVADIDLLLFVFTIALYIYIWTRPNTRSVHYGGQRSDLCGTLALRQYGRKDTMSFKVFVSLPMAGMTLDQIRDKQQQIFSKYARPEWELIDTVITELPASIDDEDSVQARLWCLGRSIQMLGEADLVIFDEDWRKANGCRTEHLVCDVYKIPYIYDNLEDYNESE